MYILGKKNSLKVLVTGGSGFIGTHLCKELVQKGHSVRVLDLAFPEIPVSGVSYEQGDVRGPETLITCVRDIDIIYHFAAMVSVPLCEQTPLYAYQTNLMGTVNLLEAIRDESMNHNKPIRLIFASSSSLYGDQGSPNTPISETSSLAVPLSLYAAQKSGAEQVIYLYCRKKKVPSVVFRLFNVFGPGQKNDSPYSGVISKFVFCALSGKTIEIHGDGSQTRDFVFVKDVASAFSFAMKIPPESCDAMPINIGTGNATPIRVLATEVMKVTGHPVPIQYTPSREGDVKHSCASIERAKRVLSWNPKISLAQGLELMKHDKSSQPLRRAS